MYKYIYIHYTYSYPHEFSTLSVQPLINWVLPTSRPVVCTTVRVPYTNEWDSSNLPWMPIVVDMPIDRRGKGNDDDDVDDVDDDDDLDFWKFWDSEHDDFEILNTMIWRF